MSDRYLKIVLTVIAVELFWLGVKDIGIPLRAQQPAAAQAAQPGQPPAKTPPAQAPMPVVIKAIEIETPVRGALPVYSAMPLSVEVTGPVRIEADEPIAIVTNTPLKVEADRPLPVESVPYTPAKKPGE